MHVTGILAEKGFHAFEGERKSHTGLKVPNVWIVIADETQAYIYRKTATGLDQICRAQAKGKQMKSVDDHVFNSQGLNPDKPRQTNPRHGKSYQANKAFIQRLVEWLAVAEKEGAFDELVLAAAPQTLGNLRGCLTRELRARVRNELNKDLTKMSVAEIQRHLGPAIEFKQ